MKTNAWNFPICTCISAKKSYSLAHFNQTSKYCVLFVMKSAKQMAEHTVISKTSVDSMQTVTSEISGKRKSILLNAVANSVYKQQVNSLYRVWWIWT